MEFKIRWRKDRHSKISSMRSLTEAGAEQWAVARFADGMESIWIEDGEGRIAMTYQELKRRRSAGQLQERLAET